MLHHGVIWNSFTSISDKLAEDKTTALVNMLSELQFNWIAVIYETLIKRSGQD